MLGFMFWIYLYYCHATSANNRIPNHGFPKQTSITFYCNIQFIVKSIFLKIHFYLDVRHQSIKGNETS